MPGPSVRCDALPALVRRIVVDGQAHDDAQLNHVHVQSNDSTTFSIATSNGNVAVKMTLYLNDTWTGNSRSTFIA